ncbi:indolepyruvate ferredoxin oxidoreductase subunit alpha [Mycoplasmatota bacterium WC44]
MKKLMTGNEAIARGVYESGTHFASAYPGTPSTEILQNITQYKEVIAEWAPNEKVALEAVIGASLVGGRSIAAMKHVGVNVAADPLFTYSYSGVLGGMILVTADEPGMHSSQNEQDNRNFAPFAKIPMFEPSNSQEAKDFVKDAFELSEEYDTPVLFRVTTRVCHSKGIVELGEREEVEVKEYVKNVRKNVAVPAFATDARHRVEVRTNKLRELSNNCKWNYATYNDRKIGVIASGGAYEYAQEAFGDKASYLKLGFTYPLPTTLIEEFAKEVETLYIIEENDPYIENHVKLLGVECIGKDLFPYTGEMTSDVIRECVYEEKIETLGVNAEKIVNRPPTFCPGCPHRPFFLDLGKRKNTIIAGDIGCYALGFGEPYNAMDWIVCMGGSFSTGHGAQKVLNRNKDNEKRLVSVMGDSTFFHTGVNSLLDVVYNNSNTINVILDNRITGMTGGQDNPGTGYQAQGEVTQVVDIEAIVRACGVKHVRRLNPNNTKDVKETLNWAYLQTEPCVIITDWPCVLKRKYNEDDQVSYPEVFQKKMYVIEDKCIGCRACLRTACPPLMWNAEDKKVSIDRATCVGCTVCAQVCPTDAIVFEGE